MKVRQRKLPDGLRLLSAKDVSALTKKPVRTVYDWMRTGGLPSVKVGRSRFVPAAALERLIGKALASVPEQQA
jgi:excisionase family DNA binding protein